MNTFTKLLAGAAFAATASLAIPASAATMLTFAQYQQKGTADTFKWTPSASKTGGRLEDIGDPTVIFRIWDTAASPGPTVDVLAKMQLDAKVDNGTPAQTLFGKRHQGGLHGAFSFTALSAFTRNNITYAAKTNLLAATFTGGSIFGAGTGSVDGDALSGAVVDFTSGVIDTSPFSLDTFTFSLNAIRRGKQSGLTHVPGKALSAFTGTTTGQFAAAIPEPATWAMMICGFFGAGVMIRRRRQVPAAV